MRLIDADALEKKLQEQRELYVEMGMKGAEHLLAHDFLRYVWEAPTVNPARHGRWEVAGNTTHYYTCSVCGKPGDGFDNYCRNCGALMGRPCDKCQGWDCYGCDYKQTERSE